MLRKTLTILLAAASFLLLFAGGLVGSSMDDVMRTVDHSRQLEAAFEQAAAFVRDFQQREGRLPTQEEFAGWASSTLPGPYAPNGMEIRTSDLPPEVVGTLGEPPDSAFALAYWRGEWMEYYAGWSGESSLTFDAADYFVFGSAFADMLMYLVAGGLVGSLAWLVWPRSCPFAA